MTVLRSALVFVVVEGVVTAGFLESIDQFVREGRYDVGANVRRFATRMVAFQAVGFCSLLAWMAVSLVSPPLAIVSPIGLNLAALPSGSLGRCSHRWTTTGRRPSTERISPTGSPARNVVLGGL